MDNILIIIEDFPFHLRDRVASLSREEITSYIIKGLLFDDLVYVNSSHKSIENQESSNVNNLALQMQNLDLKMEQLILNSGGSSFDSNSTVGSSVKGQIGESFVYDELSISPGWEVMSRKTGEGYSGDLIVKTSRYRILVEVKNYGSGRSVPRAEVEKFYRDIDASASFDAALFISLQSPITGILSKNEIFKFEKHESKPVVFLQSDIGELYRVIIGILFRFIEDKLSTRELNRVIDHISQIRDLIETLGTLRTALTEAKKNFNNSIERIVQSIYKVEIKVNDNIRDILGLIDQEEEQRIYKESGAWRWDNITEEISKAFQDSFYIRNLVHKTLVNKIGNIIIQQLSENSKISINKKQNSIFFLDGKYGIKFMKTKSYIMIKPNNLSQIQFSPNMELKSGIITLEIKTDNEKNIIELLK